MELDTTFKILHGNKPLQSTITTYNRNNSIFPIHSISHCGLNCFIGDAINLLTSVRQHRPIPMLGTWNRAEPGPIHFKLNSKLEFNNEKRRRELRRASIMTSYQLEMAGMILQLRMNSYSIFWSVIIINELKYWNNDDPWIMFQFKLQFEIWTRVIILLPSQAFSIAIL